MRFKRVYLNEAYSPSMPGWLKKYITSHKSLEKEIKKVSSEIDKARDAYRRDLITRDEYNNLSAEHRAKRNELQKSFNRYDRDLGRDRYGNQGIDIFQNKNVNEKTLDLSRAKFIESPMPKSTDPILSDTGKMCFVHLVSINEDGELIDETVWVPNITSQSEKFVLNNGKVMAMKQLATNNKQLQQHAKDFCYVDLTDNSNFTNQMLQDRRDAKSGVVDRAQITNWSDPQSIKQYDWKTGKNVDKSGYVVISTAQKYADELRKRKVKKIPGMIDECRYNIIQLQKDLSDFVQSVSLSDDLSYISNDAVNAINNAQSELRNSLNYLRITLRDIESLNAQPDSEYRQNEVIDDLKIIQKYINDAYIYLKPYMSVSIDWDEFDDNIYTDIEFDEY